MPLIARLLSVPLLAALVTVVAAAEKSPKRRTEQLLELLSMVKKAPENGSLTEAQKAANRELFKRLDVFFNFETMTEKVLRQHAEQLTEEQLVVFRDMFPRLIRLVAYPDSGSFLEGTKVTIGKEQITGTRAEVPAHLVRAADDIEMDVTFYWQDDGTWRLVDVAFGGAPLSKDYQNRIGRVLEDKGAEGLLGKLRKRLKTELRSVR